MGNFTQPCKLKTGDAAQWLENLRFKSEDPRFDPLAEQGEEQFFLYLRVNSCADLFVPDPPSCVWHAPKCVHTLKIPYSYVVKE